MKRLHFLFLMAILTMSGFAKIDLTVDINNLVFTGVNNANNYRFVLSPYEFKNGGPQFQLEVVPIDASKPSQFTTDDLQDQNYWEPMFKYYTKEMAGQEMTAQDNIKRLYLGDVMLLPGQFIDYNELHIIGFKLSKDYTLAQNCFMNAGERLEEVNVECDGVMNLMPGCMPADKNYVVNVNSVLLQQTWLQYKNEFNCQYTVNLIAGAGITSLKIMVNMGEEDETMEMPATGMPLEDLTDGGTYGEKQFIVRGYEAMTSGSMQSLQLVAAIYEKGGTPKEWISAPASSVGDDRWVASDIDINLLEGLTAGKTYVLEAFVEATDADGQKYYYNNGGSNYKVQFMPEGGSGIKGDLTGDGKVDVVDVNALINLILKVATPSQYPGVVDVDGDGKVDVADVNEVINIILKI
ncbi:MAG: dockerin type I repeat-containing protein [Muribaculaceae bacterium]|nr:dockerin type I repeat-containing protein [Muribaculaceae bacterium]